MFNYRGGFGAAIPLKQIYSFSSTLRVYSFHFLRMDVYKNEALTPYLDFLLIPHDNQCLYTLNGCYSSDLMLV